MITHLQKLRIYNFVEDSYLNELKEELRQNEYYIYELNGKDITDARSLFAEIKKTLPQDPPLSGKVNWDAFLDSIWGGLDELGKEKVAIVWTNVENMLESSLPDLVTAIELFRDLALSVSNPDTRISVPVSLTIFLVGDGNNFSSNRIS